MSYFQNLFLTCSPIRVQEITDCVEARISSEDTRRLMQPITDEEVRQTMFQILANKSPGLDGFTRSFYHE